MLDESCFGAWAVAVALARRVGRAGPALDAAAGRRRRPGHRRRLLALDAVDHQALTRSCKNTSMTRGWSPIGRWKGERRATCDRPSTTYLADLGAVDFEPRSAQCPARLLDQRLQRR